MVSAWNCTIPARKLLPRRRPVLPKPRVPSRSGWITHDFLSVGQHPITDGQCQITGNFTAEEATSLANKINSGALPFNLVAENYSTINPTLGLGARDVMLVAGAIAFIIVCIYMIIFFRLPGVVAMFALMGQGCGFNCRDFRVLRLHVFFHPDAAGIAGIILGVVWALTRTSSPLPVSRKRSAPASRLTAPSHWVTTAPSRRSWTAT